MSTTSLIQTRSIVVFLRFYNSLKLKKSKSSVAMSEYVSKAVVVLSSFLGLYVVRRVVRKLYEDYRDR